MLPIQNPGLDLRDLVVEQVPISSLKRYPTNSRTHSKKQIRQLATSIMTFGWTNPVLVDADNRIIAGHGRVEAAKLLSTPHVPVLRIEDLTEAQIKAYVIADNKLAELAGWDAEILANELQLLSELDFDFDIEVTGFEMGEIDVLIESQGGEHDPADDVPDVNNARSPVTLLGDVWLLGPHRLACGNALSSESYSLLMEGRQAQRHGEIRSPTLCLWGVHDPWQTIRDGERLSREIPNARLVPVENASHWIPHDTPEIFSEEVRSFLAIG
jgi:pimeloyl-ACP methyl ester carboxylesterase